MFRPLLPQYMRATTKKPHNYLHDLAANHVNMERSCLNDGTLPAQHYLYVQYSVTRSGSLVTPR